MKNSNSLLLLSSVAFTSTVFANSLTVSIDSFSAANLFSIVPGSSLDLRIAQLTSPAGANTATHILIEQLAPIDNDNTGVYGSPYQAIEIASGAVQDTGVLYLQLPQAPELPAGSVASPIVGIVERAGPWSDYGLQNPDPGSNFGGASGSGSYATPGILSMSLNYQGATYTGQAAYSPVGTGSIDMEAFTLSGPLGVTLSLSASMLVRDGMGFSGTVANLSDGADYNSLFFQISLTSIPDVDGDGTPDIVDTEIGSGGLTPNQWNSTFIGSVFAVSAEWGYSPNMGWVYLGLGSPWVYQISFGWFALADSAYSAGSDSTAFWLNGNSTGWVYFTDLYDGYFHNLVSMNPVVWELNNFLFPN